MTEHASPTKHDPTPDPVLTAKAKEEDKKEKNLTDSADDAKQKIEAAKKELKGKQEAFNKASDALAVAHSELNEALRKLVAAGGNLDDREPEDTKSESKSKPKS